MKVLITGATGFIGSILVSQLIEVGRFVVQLAVRNRENQPHSQSFSISIPVGNVSPNTSWTDAISKVNVVVHLAARVHVIHDAAADPLTEFRRVNTDGTLNLARQAAAAGVHRFIFVSSVKVNGEETTPGLSFKEFDQPAPQDAYAISKYEAEKGLLRLAAETGMEVVIIRPPLVYGPGVKANFLSMMRWLARGVPLPLGAIHNRRSLVALDNLVDLIITCIDHPAAANQVFLVSDGEELSTTELLQRTAAALGKSARLLPVPQGLLEAVLKMSGKGELARRLCGSLQVDNSKARGLLGWSPPVSVDAALEKTARFFWEHQCS